MSTASTGRQHKCRREVAWLLLQCIGCIIPVACQVVAIRGTRILTGCAPPKPLLPPRASPQVLEETPSPLLTDDLRKALTGAACRLGAAACYRSAGTVEFIFDEDESKFYFLEVNTRLQVNTIAKRNPSVMQQALGDSKLVREQCCVDVLHP